MRIAWMVYGDLAQPTGGYVYDRLVVEGLRARGDEVEVVDPLGMTSVPGGVDVVVGDGLCARELGSLFERAGRGVARVLLVHHFASWEVERCDREPMRVVEARAVGASDRLIATGATTRERLGEAYPGLRVDVVVPGADRLRRHARAPAGPRRVDLLFVGSLVARKRLIDLLDAVEELADPRVTLTLIGDPTREPEHAAWIKARIEASPILRAQVALVGVASDEALARSMAQADALVLPSSLEGYGMVLTESLAAGLPVLAARPAAAAAGIAESEAVCVFDGGTGLASALRRFTSDPALRDAMRIAASAAVLPRWEETVAAFHESLVQARRRP